MNKVYTNFWDVNLNRPVITSEYGSVKSARKTSSIVNKSIRGVIAILVCSSMYAGDIAYSQSKVGQTIGRCGSADYRNSIAIAGNDSLTARCGNITSAYGDGAIAVGVLAVAGGAGLGSSLGGNAAADSTQIAIGYDSSANGGSAIAFGRNAVANGVSSIAIGVSSRARVNSSIVLGEYASAENIGSVALGTRASAQGMNSIAAGSFALASGENSVVFGAHSSDDGRANVFSVGSSELQRQIAFVARGTKNTDATNFAQLQETASIFGGGAGIDGNGNITLPKFTLNSGDYSTVYSALIGLDDGMSTLSDNVSNLAAGTIGIVRQNGNVIEIGAELANVDVISLEGASQWGGIPRRLTGLAPGVSMYDAVNVAQLNLLTEQLGGGAHVEGELGLIIGPKYNILGKDDLSLEESLYALSDTISASGLGLISQNVDTREISIGSDVDGNMLTIHGNAGDRTLRGVALGVEDTDAVNLKQLKDVAYSLGGGASIDANGVMIDPVYTINQANYHTVGDALGALDTSVTVISGDVNTLAGNVQAASAGLISLAARVTVNDGLLADTASYLGGGASIKDGTLTAPNYTVNGNVHNTVGGALDALNLGVTTVNHEVEGLTTNITNLEQNIISQINTITSGEAGLVQQDDDSKRITVASGLEGGVVDFTGVESRTLTGIKAGELSATSSDAVVGSQLFATNEAVSGLDHRVGGAEDSINILNTDISSITNQLTNITAGGIGIVQQSSVTSHITVGGASGGEYISFMGSEGARRLGGVAAGVGNLEAANIGQLRQLLSSLDSNASIDANGLIIGPSYNVLGQTGLTLSESLAALNQYLLADATEVVPEEGKTSNIIEQDGNSSHINIGTDLVGNSVNVSGSEGDRILAGVQDGIADNHAATVGQVKEMILSNAMIASNNVSNYSVASAIGKDALSVGAGSSASGQKSVALGALATASGNESTALGAHSIASGKGSTVTGSHAKASGEHSTAVGHSAKATGENSVAIGHNASATANNSVAIGANSVANTDNSVSVGSVGAERYITNVAEGIRGTDAVNVNQLNRGLGIAHDRINGLERRIDKMDLRLNAGLATSIATSSLPLSHGAGESMVSAAIGGYGSEAALAIGYSQTSENGKWTFRASGTVNTQGKFGVGIGAGFRW